MQVIVGFNLDIIIYVLFSHWIADFLFQSKWMIEHKLEDIFTMLTHVIVYTFLITVLLWWLIPSLTALLVFILTISFVHLVVDTVTIKIIDKLKGGRHSHWIYAVMSFDQLVCTSVLFATLINLVNYFSP
jgi:hypothetical protein